jgi:predicted RNA binding protein with dsRBD fold (UPF0201 family)
MNKEMVKIAEKVKFWEEQDRINKAIIPRLLKNHELITELSGRFSEYTDKILKLEHQCLELSKKYELLQKEEISEAKKEVFLLRRNNKILSIFTFIAVAVSLVSLLLK